MTDQPQADLLTLFYAAISAVEDGKVSEAEVEQHTTLPDGSGLTLTVSFRRDPIPAER